MPHCFDLLTTKPDLVAKLVCTMHAMLLILVLTTNKSVSYDRERKQICNAV